jgi:hypothetical protein
MQPDQLTRRRARHESSYFETGRYQARADMPATVAERRALPLACRKLRRYRFTLCNDMPMR